MLATWNTHAQTLSFDKYMTLQKVCFSPEHVRQGSQSHLTNQSLHPASKRLLPCLESDWAPAILPFRSLVSIRHLWRWRACCRGPVFACWRGWARLCREGAEGWPPPWPTCQRNMWVLTFDRPAASPSNSDDGDSEASVPRLHGRARCGSLPRRSSGPSLTPSTGRRASPRNRWQLCFPQIKV